MADPTVSAAQAALNQLGADPPLVVDGIAGPLTSAAIRDFQSSHGLVGSGQLDDPTLQALGLEKAPSFFSKLSPSNVTIAKVRGIEKLSTTDLQALVQTSNNIQVHPDWLASVMSFESGFSPSIKNAAGSGATGLIQFMPATAAGLGTSVDALAAMTFVEQLPFVERYFAPYVGKLQSLEDTYLAVFYPAFIGKADDAVLGSQGSAIYDQNSGFDRAGKGYVTKYDITSTIRGVLAAAAGRVTVPGTRSAVASFGAIATIVLLAGAAAALLIRGKA